MGEVGRGSKREGLYVYRQLIDVVVQQKPTQYCKTAILKLKKLSGTNQRRAVGNIQSGFTHASQHDGLCRTPVMRAGASRTQVLTEAWGLSPGRLVGR